MAQPVESSRLEEAAEAAPTLPLPAYRRRLLQIASPAGPVALGGVNPAARAVRRLMVTPWFAAATGVVVAAGLFIYAPHAQLRLPNGAVGRVPCQTEGCGIPTPNGKGAPAGSGLLPMGSGVKSAGKSQGTGSAVRRLKFAYRVLWQSQGRFGMVISVSGNRLPRTWRLAFTMPGDSITDVQGAAWRPSGRYGIVASWPAGTTPWQVRTSDGGDRGFRTSDGQGATFVVLGTGTFVSPQACSFDGASCAFTILQHG